MEAMVCSYAMLFEALRHKCSTWRGAFAAEALFQLIGSRICCLRCFTADRARSNRSYDAVVPEPDTKTKPGKTSPVAMPSIHDGEKYRALRIALRPPFPSL